jgi:hypothetical protein
MTGRKWEMKGGIGRIFCKLTGVLSILVYQNIDCGHLKASILRNHKLWTSLRSPPHLKLSVCLPILTSFMAHPAQSKLASLAGTRP